MPLDPDDPRLTAFALGELDPSERTEVEALLGDDPDARAFVAGVEETARLLRDEFRHEATATNGLDTARREAIEECLAGSPMATIPIAAAPAKAHFRAWMPVAAAAGIIGVAAAVTLPGFLAGRKKAPIELAQAERPAARTVAKPRARYANSVEEDRDRTPILDAMPGEPAAVAAASAAPAAPPAPALKAAVPAGPRAEPGVVASGGRAGSGMMGGAGGGMGGQVGLASRSPQSGANARGLKPGESAPARPALAQTQADGLMARDRNSVRREVNRQMAGANQVGGNQGSAAGPQTAGNANVDLLPFTQGRADQPVRFENNNGQPAQQAQAARNVAQNGVASNAMFEAEGLARSRQMASQGQQQAGQQGQPGGQQGQQGAQQAQALPYQMLNTRSSPAQVAQDGAGQNPSPAMYGEGINAGLGQGNIPGQPFRTAPLGGSQGQPPGANAMASNAPAPAAQPANAQAAGEAAANSQGKPTGVYNMTTAAAPALPPDHYAYAVPPIPQAPAAGIAAKGKDATLFGMNVAGNTAAPAPAPPLASAPAPAVNAGFDALMTPAVPGPADAKGLGDAGLIARADSFKLDAANPAKPATTPAPIGLQVTTNEKGNLEALHEMEKKGAAETGKQPAKVAAETQAPAKGPTQLALVEEARELAKIRGEMSRAVVDPKQLKDLGEREALLKQKLAEQTPQLALVDEARKERLAEVDREVDVKRDEVRQLTEQAEGLRRQLVREQTRVDREAYARFYDHPFLSVLPGNELSTFAIDVDTGSYANCRRFLSQGQLPPVDAVRIEELLNAFRYDDPAPKDDKPFAVTCEVAACPWDGGHRLARVGLKGKTIEADKRPASNLVFLIDVSGSMSDLNKLPLLKAGMKLLVEQLTENDRVGIVTYSNDVKEAFPSTPCHKKAEILAAIDALQAGGGTNGGAGIQMAYGMAEKHFLKGGTNRVILATDGDFNLGMTKDELLATSEARAKSNIFLTVIGFGEGNIQEDFMEQLADKGNGHYLYIDTIDEARKRLVRDLSGTLVTIAKDVKIQVEFNPERCASYRLIGYENRVMAAQDFRNDKKDAGEIGAGHSVTALYEIVPTGAPAQVAQAADRPLKYRKAKADVAADKPAESPELLTVFLRYKQPEGDKATEISQGVVDDGRDFGHASTDLRFSAAVAGFGMLLRESPYKGSLTYPAVLEIGSSALGSDPNGDRKGFLDLVRQAEQVEGGTPQLAK